MELSYRGLHYDYDPPTIDMMEGEAGGLYRGCQWQVRYPRHIPVPQPSHSLKYRGVSYFSHASSHANVENEVSDPAPATIPTPVATVNKTSVLSNPKPQKKPQKDIWQEVAHAHQISICRSLERRMNAAQAKGDQKLINLLQKESQDLACTLF